MAVTFAFLQSAGTSPCSRLLLKIIVNRGAISSASSFRILAGMESGPLALFGLTFRNNFVTPSSDIWSSFIGGKGSPTGSGILETSSWVYTDTYCRPRMSTLSLALEKSLPFSLRGEIPVLSFLVFLMKLQNHFCFGVFPSSSPTSIRLSI